MWLDFRFAIVLACALFGQACGAREAPGVGAPASSAGVLPDASGAAGPREATAEAVEPSALAAPAGFPDATPNDPLPDGLAGLGVPGDERPGRCPPEPRPTHCILLEVKDPSAASIAALLERLRGEGLEAGVEGSAVVVQLDEATLERVFGARVVYRSSAASATFGTVCEASLDGGRVPGAWLDQVRGFELGHQICE